MDRCADGTRLRALLFPRILVLPVGHGGAGRICPRFGNCTTGQASQSQAESGGSPAAALPVAGMLMRQLSAGGSLERNGVDLPGSDRGVCVYRLAARRLVAKTTQWHRPLAAFLGSDAVIRGAAYQNPRILLARPAPVVAYSAAICRQRGTTGGAVLLAAGLARAAQCVVSVSRG